MQGHALVRVVMIRDGGRLQLGGEGIGRVSTDNDAGTEGFDVTVMLPLRRGQ